MRWFRRPVRVETHYVSDPQLWNEGYDACLKITEVFGKKAARTAHTRNLPVHWNPIVTGYGSMFPTRAQITDGNRKGELARAEAHLKEVAEDAAFKARVLAALEDK